MENRRSFVTKTGAALAAGYLNLNPLAKGANERVTLAYPATPYRKEYPLPTL